MRLFFEKGKKILMTVGALAGIALALVFSKECTNGILSGISFCIQVLVPSLFLFLVLSSLLIKSGAAATLSKPLEGVSQALFSLPGVGAAAVVIAMLGGYPVGASLSLSLYQSGQLEKSQARKLALIAVAAGPGFLINFVGAALLNSQKAGALLLISQLLSTLTVGVLIGKAVPAEHKAPSAKPRRAPKQLLVEAVTDASKSVMGMCAMVLVFSALIEVARTVFEKTPIVGDLLAGFLEITTGCNRMCGKYPLALIAFFIGFSGLSVHFQIFSIVKDLEIRKGLFFLFRIIQGIIAAIITYVLVRFFPIPAAVFSTTDQSATLLNSSSIWGSGALVFSSMCFLSSISKEKHIAHNNPFVFRKHFWR